jgi:peptidoglycan/LPS O-acetylase OafA/YrhL
MKYRAEIDGLRALAVIPVILYHAGFKLFGGGYVGVDVFFVISGYLITTIILAELEAGTFSLIHFYERRARRILPALFVVMFACIPFAWFWLLPHAMKQFSESLVAVSTYASNILFWRTSGYFDSATELKPLIHTWSLAVEEQYYVLFPLFLMLTWKLGKRWIVGLLAVVFAISLVGAQWLSVTHPSFNFYMLPTRVWELLIGAFIAFYYAHNNIKKHNHLIEQLGSLLGLSLIAYSVFAYNDQTPFPSVYALAPTLGAALIIIFATHKTVVGSLLGSKPFVAIGLISYSAYLWHQPMFAFARQRSLDEPGMYLMSALAVLSFAFAYLSWKYIERPFRNKHRISRNKVFAYGVLCSVLFIGIGLAGYLSKGFETRNPTIQKLLSSNMSVFEKQVKFCWDGVKASPNVGSACLLGDSKSPPIFAIIGDSSVGALVEPLNSNAYKKGISGFGYTFRSCPPLYSINPIPFSDEDKKCAELRESFFSNLQTNGVIPRTIILGSRYPILLDKSRFDNKEGGIENGGQWVWDVKANSDIEYKNKISANLLNSIRLILESGRKVILIYPMPEAGWDVPARLAKIYKSNGEIRAEDASTSYIRFIERNKDAYIALDSLGDHKNLIRIKPEKLLCNTYVENRCVTHINGTPLYFDDNHLSNAGAQIINDEIIKFIH